MNMQVNHRYPIYVISKGRPACITSRELTKMGVTHYVVVEPVDVDDYRDVSGKLLVLPFSDLGQGSIPARNWVWEHSAASGYDRHWVLDDNIEAFNRLNRNMKPRVKTGAIFCAAEDFVDRYENVAIAGFNYFNFCKSTDKVPPFYLNTRIYSCILIKNDLPHRWRGRYNEDTDLSIRVLKDGWCTVLFNAFLCGKVTTMRMKGGNTDTVYNDGSNRMNFAKSLQEQHPDVVKVVWKFNRWHHHVNYEPFKRNKLIKKQGIIVPKGINNYGMVFKER